ncbi:MAG: phospholipid carrier-dependent glycosyltransferase [Anaerolineae bacterium]|nr:phospholipid carrier-dependent glycosyltransferase [Anaerolineae bacterium]
MSGYRKTLDRLPLVLLLVFFALGMAQVRHASITFDEGPHLAIGYATLRTGDLRLQPVHIHPPLANVLAASPLLLQDDLPDPTTVDGWRINSLSAITDAVVWQYPRPERIATAGRVPILLLGILLCALTNRWATDLGGRTAGLLALGLCALDPNLIAHGGLVTTDTAAASLSVATLYTLYRAGTGNQRTGASGSPRVSRRLLVLTGVLLGLAQLVKVSALMLVPVTGLLVVMIAWLRERSLRGALASGTRYGLIILLTASLTLWAGYGFEVAEVPQWSLRLPAATHFRIFLSLQEHYDLGHPAFALGQVSDHGWWWYFPAAFALKTPLPTLLLLSAATVAGMSHVASVVRRWRRRSELVGSEGPMGPSARRIVVLATVGLFPALYAVSSLFSTVDIGYRHLLPVLPFLYVGAAGALVRAPLHKRPAATAAPIAAVALYAWLATGTISVAPHQLTFFNALAGGAPNGYRYLVDSNLDWGQNLWDLAEWMQAGGKDHVYYAHYSPADPKVYGVNASFLPPDPKAVPFAPWRPAPGAYAMGATVLQGPYAPDINTYAWFRSREPVAKLGNALFVYEVPETQPPGWITLCEPRNVETLTGNLRVSTLRILHVDCTQTAVYPAGSGCHLAPADLAAPSSRTGITTLRTAEGAVSMRLYEPVYHTPGVAAEPAMPLDGPLTYLGYDVSHAQDSVLLETHWRVDQTPGRPLSLMAHLIDPDGMAVSVGDGLGFPIEQWLPGDRIVQQHAITVPDVLKPGTYELRTGAYWLDTMERMNVAGPDPEIGDSILVGHLADLIAESEPDEIP